MAISSHMNNNRLSSNVSSSKKKFFLISPADCELRTVELNTEKKKLNYNLLLEKVKIILNKPSNF